MTSKTNQAVKSINWMREKACDCSEDGTALLFMGELPWYATQAIQTYFKENEVSKSSRTILLDDWNITLAYPKRSTSKLTVSFNRTDSWHIKRDLLALGFLPNEAVAIVKIEMARSYEERLNFYASLEAGQITPDNYSF